MSDREQRSWIAHVQLGVGDDPVAPEVIRFLAKFDAALAADAVVEALEDASGTASHRVRFRLSATSHQDADALARRLAHDALRAGMRSTARSDAIGWTMVVEVSEPAEVDEEAVLEDAEEGSVPPGFYPVAFVADDLDGGFIAHVELDERGPFSVTHGPRRATLGGAVAWAREQAPRVIVRIGDEHYSVGDEPVRDLPQIAEPTEGPDEDAPRPLPTRWRVGARTGWYRDDRDDVLQRFGEALRADPTATDVAAATHEVGFSVAFTIIARDEVEAHAIASSSLRAAWERLRIEAAPGDDYEASGITVERVSAEPDPA
jgi:hypothetical protein